MGFPMRYVQGYAPVLRMRGQTAIMSNDKTCDVLVIGSGAGGLTTAVTCAHARLKVIAVEKAPVFGGTMAFSGGVLWIPGNRYGEEQNPSDTREAARTYLQVEAGNHFDAEAVDALLDTGPEEVVPGNRTLC